MKVTHKIIAWLAGAVLLVALGVVVSFLTYSQIEESAAVRKHTNAVLDSAGELLSALRDAETGQRGYLLTGDKAFLEPYLAVRDRISGQLVELRRLTLVSAAQKHLDALAPLVDAKLVDMSHAIELRRNHDVTAALASVRGGQGRQLMDAIRAEMGGVIQIEQGVLAQRETEFQASMRQLFTIIVATTLLTLMFVLAFAWLIYRESQQRIKNLVHLETQHLLDNQRDTNKQLQQTNAALHGSKDALRKAAPLQSAIFNSANFSSIATDAKGVIQIFNVGAERMLGYAAADVMNKITPADISDPQEVIARAKALSAELGTPITPGFEALVFKASRGIEDIYELTYIRKDGSRFPAVVSVTALRDAQDTIIGYLLIGTDNTARKQAEAEKQRLLEIQEETHKQLQRTNATLQISEEKLTVTLNSIGDAVIATDAEARVTFLNPIAEQLTGWTQAQASGHPVDEIFHIINQETRQPATIPVMETLAHGTVQGLANHTVLIARDGSECAIADSCAPIRDRDGQVIGAVLVFRDVTKEYAVQQALRDSTALIQTMLNTVVDGIITIHARGGIVETVNPAAEKMFGYSAAELIGQNFSLLIPELDRDQRNGSLEYYSASDEARAKGLGREVTGRRKDGSIFPMEMAVSEMWLGNQRYFTGILRDTTMRKQVEAERAQLDRTLQDKNVELESARFVAEKANLAKSVFLSRMSHELRTPLNAILGFAQLLEGGSPAPTAAQIVRLHQIIKAGWYLLELINEILDLALIESGKLSLSREPVSLIDVMRECQAMIEPQAQKHHIHISFLPFDNTWFAHADRTRVKQVMINLLSNAIKYNREHGTVEVKCTGTPERIRIRISDSGMGLPPEKLLQLFQPFNRLGQESGTEEGTGIGLVVTKQLVELMGGTVGVKSTVGVGSEFWIELIRDFTLLQPATGDIMPAELVPQAHGDAARHTLLYVEDNPANLLLVEQIIQDHPHVSMLSARDGNLGVALARAHLPDVILMDINLPGISGIEAMNILRQDPATAHIPVIALSANAMLRDIEKGLEAGFFRYLTKPIKVNEFMNALDDALKFAETGKFSEKELVNTNETGQKP
ncbi:MAG: PAS domain S-box protein [Gallionella sp.]|nr:PAS domain S-box protein [Gallionella sp.]